MKKISKNEELFKNLNDQKAIYRFFVYADNKYLLECQDQLFYINKTISQNQVNGILYQTNYDENQNPNYQLQEGNFLVEIKNGKIQYLLNDMNGIEYQGKSKQIKYQGYFLKGQYQMYEQKLERSISQKEQQTYKIYDNRIKENKQNTNLKSISLIKQVKDIQQQIAQQPSQIKKIIISDANTGEVLNTNNKRRQYNYYNIQLWCKYNQQISSRDIEILDINSKSWVTSNILDGYCFYLNQQTQKEYFLYQQQDQKKIKRILFVPSSLTSSFWDGAQAQEQCKKEFLEFEKINYQLNNLYSHIGFVINKNNIHWQFLLFDLENSQIILFDSLGWQENQKITKFLKYFFSSSFSQQIKDTQTIQLQKFKQQNDGYSCGYHVASFMKYLYEKQFSPNIEYKYNEIGMKKILKELLQK